MVQDRLQKPGETPATSSELEQLHQTIHQLHTSESVKNCTQRTVETAISILGFDWCLVVSADEDAGHFEVVATAGETELDEGDRPLEFGDGIVGEVYDHGESKIVDCSTLERDQLGERIESAITIPVGDWGVFQALGTEPDAFDERDLQLLELLVTPLAATIDRIQTEKALRDRTRTLTRQNERLDQFASVVSHDLRSPLNVAQLSVEGELATRDSKQLTMAHNALERMDEMIHDMLQLARAETSVDEVEPVVLQSVVERAWKTVETSDAMLEITLSHDATVKGELSLLRSIFENLFSNAVSHNDPPVTVCVGLLGDEENPTGFYVEDDGTGIEPEERSEVFEYGYTTGEGASGLGLSIVRDFVEAHGWTIRLTDGADGGARFEIETSAESAPPARNQEHIDNRLLQGLNP